MTTDPIALSRWELYCYVEAKGQPEDLNDRKGRSRIAAITAMYRSQLRQHLGMPDIRDPWTRVQLDPTILARLLNWILPLERQGIVHFARGFLTEKAFFDRPEWYVIKPHRDDFPIERNSSGVECVGSWILVSDEFVRSVHRRQLTGLRFVPEQDENRFRQRRAWFRPIPTSPIGRGADHPWVSREAYRLKSSVEEREPQETHGIHHFDSDQLLRDLPGQSELMKQLIARFPADELHISGARRVPRHHLPETDFSMLFSVALRDDVCIKASSAALLQRDGVLSPQDCEPLIVLDGLKRDWEYDLPVDMNSLLRVKRTIEREVAGIKEKPVPAQLEHEWASAVALDAARRAFANERRRSPMDEAKLQTAIEKIGLMVPDLWRELMISAGEFGVIGECAIGSPDGWATEHFDHQDLFNEAPPVPGFSYLLVGSNISGDTFALEVPTNPSGRVVDAPILLFDHEIQRFTQRWPSITQYIEEWLRIE